MILTRRTTGGGAEKFAGALALGLSRDFDVEVWASREPDESLDDLRAAGVPAVSLGRSATRTLLSVVDPRPWLRLIRRLRSGDFDVLNSHTHGSNVWAAVVGRLAGVPVIVATEHSWSYEGHPIRRFLDRDLIGRFSSAFVAISRRDAARMVSVERVRPAKIRVIPNGLPASFAPEPGEGARVREDVGIPPDALVVGSVAVLRREKALDVLIRSFARLASSRDDAWLLIVGDGERRASLETEARGAGVDDRVVFAGRRSDVARFYDALDIMVLSSLREGTPLSALEAMACGCPLIATEVGGLPDLIDDGTSGLLIPPADEDALSEMLAALAADPELRARIGEAGRVRVRSRHSFERTLAAWGDLFRELRGARA